MVKDLVSEFVKSAPPYNFGVGEPVEPLREGVEEILQLNKNENPFGISPLAREEMVRQCGISNRYPDIRGGELIEKLAAKHGVSEQNIMVTQGATSALGFIGEAFVKAGDEILVTSPTYPNYYNIVKKNEGKIVDVPMDPETYTPNFEALLAAITPKTKIVFLCNPNNPTGTICSDSGLRDFLHRLPKHVVLVVDEAYFEFIEESGYRSMIDEVKDDVNLIVVKTFSKIYGMAGCRIGYIISNPEIISYLQITGTGYCTNRVGLHGAIAALDDDDFVKMTIEKNREARAYLTKEMVDMGFKVWPSSSNFIFFRPTLPPRTLAKKLAGFGVMIRGDFSEARISIGTLEECKVAVAAMREILKEEGL